MNYLQRKKQAMISMHQGSIPSGYKQVEYLTSDGKQYILTDFIPKIGDSVVFYFRRKFLSKRDSPIYSTSNEDSRRQLAIILSTNRTYYKYFTTGGASELNNSFLSSKMQKVEILNDGTINISGKIYTNEVSKEKQETNAPLYIFERSDHTNHFIGDIATVNFKRNNVDVLNLIPCLDYNNRPCMYDTVSGKTYYNRGTGEFLYGEVIN